MSRKSILAFSAIALAAASALAAYTLKKSKKTQENEEDDEIHFIKIEDGDVDEKKVDPSFEEKSDEVEMTRSQYDNTLNAIISRIKEKIKEKTIESINDIVNKKENVTMMEISKGLEAVLEIELNDIEMYVMYNKYKQDEDDFVDIEKLNQEIFKDEKVKEEVESVKEEKKAEIEEEIPKENIEEKDDIKEDIDKNNE